jgi:hypothetical protein
VSQQEDTTPSHVAARAIMHAKHGGSMSGGRISGFERGWALFGMGFGKAHYGFAHDGDPVIVTMCGLAWSNKTLVFAAGNWPRCKNCSRRLGGA